MNKKAKVRGSLGHASSKVEIGRKNLKNLFKKAIEENDLDKLDQILLNDFNMKMLKKEKYLDPYIIAIRSNNLSIFGYLNRKGFELEGSSWSDCANSSNCNKKCKYENDSEIPHKNISSDFENDKYDNSIRSNYHSYSSALIEAIKCLNYDAIELLISLNVNTNSSNYKNVPLQISYNMYSVEKDKFLFNNKNYNQNRLETSLKIFKLLITKKANPNIYNSKGYRLIHQIILDKDIELLKLFISICGTMSETKKLQSNLANQASRNSIEASSSSFTEQSNEEENTSSQANPKDLLTNEQTNNWTTNKSKLNELNLQLAKVLIDAGCNMNHTDYHTHETAAFKAIVNNNYDLVKLFVVEGLNMSLRNVFGNDMLSRSIQLGRFKIARLLVVADSPIRVYSCFYKIPHQIEDLNYRNREQNSLYFDQYEYGDGDNDDNNNNETTAANNENFLQYSILKFEEFLLFLKKYTQEPRSLVDLSRLCVRNQMKKPISKWLPHLGYLPEQLKNLILLKDIDKNI